MLFKVLEEVRNIPILYIDSLECITMTILYERLLDFVKNNLPTANQSVCKSGNYKPCSSVTEMVTRLTALNWPDDLKIVLLIDEVDRLFQLDSNSFSVLLRLPQMVIQFKHIVDYNILHLHFFSWIIRFL